MKKRVLLIITCSAAVVFNLHAATSGELLQQALYAEEIEGDLPAAIESYDKIIADGSSPQDHVVQALYRKGMCHVQLGDDQQAAAALTQLVSRYPDRTELVQKAQVMLDKLAYFDPASLMPADTMIYVELGSPGRQVEAMLDMLEISPQDDPLAMVGKAAGGGPASVGPAMLTRFFNPSMLAELKKVRSLAFGCPQFDPHGSSSMVCVIHPGESDALRGMLIAALSVAGAPAKSVGDMTVLQIPDGPSFAYDDKIIFIAYPRERLKECLDKYRRLSAGPSGSYGSANTITLSDSYGKEVSLSTGGGTEQVHIHGNGKDLSLSTGSAAESSLTTGNPTFRRIDKMARQSNAATLWIDVDTLYNHLLQQAPDLPPDFQMIAGMIGLAGIDDLLLTHAIEPDGITLDAMVNLKEGVPNMGYELIKTPALASAGLEGVPPDAFYLMSVAFSTNNPGQMQQLQLMLSMGQGVPLPAGFLENIEQVALFALPGEAKIPEGMPFRLGLVLRCRDTAPVAQFLRERMAELPDSPPVQIVENKGSVVVAFEPEVADAALKALDSGASVLEEGVLSKAVHANLGEARKMVLINAGGVIRLAGIQTAYHSGADDEAKVMLETAYDHLAEQVEATTLSVYSDEQPETLALHAKLSNIPALNQLLPAIGELQAAITEMNQQQAQAQAAEWAVRAEDLMNLPPARILETASAPVIDGERDDAWDAAVTYDLTKTIYVNPGPEEQLAANYRMLWDAEKLYVFIAVTDSTPVHDLNQIWQFTDGIEFYIDATDRKPTSYGDTEYQFGLIWDRDPAAVRLEQGYGRHLHDAELAIKTTEKGYQVEASFPWNSLGTTAQAGARIGVEVQVNDNRGHGVRDAKISWHDPFDQAWLNPQYFGRAELIGAAADARSTGTQ